MRTLRTPGGRVGAGTGSGASSSWNQQASAARNAALARITYAARKVWVVSKRAANSGAARAPALQLKFRNVSGAALRAPNVRPAYMLTAVMGTPTQMPRRRNAE